MTKRIYLAGYSTRKPEVLKRLAEHLNAVVVDIRLNPVSRVPHWNRRELMRLLGDRYWHLPQLGNVNYKSGGTILIRDLDLGIHHLLDHRHDTFLLLCACVDLPLCHRKVVGEHLSTVHGLPVREVTKTEWALASEQPGVVQAGDQMALF